MKNLKQNWFLGLGWLAILISLFLQPSPVKADVAEYVEVVSSQAASLVHNTTNQTWTTIRTRTTSNSSSSSVAAHITEDSTGTPGSPTYMYLSRGYMVYTVPTLDAGERFESIELRLYCNYLTDNYSTNKIIDFVLLDDSIDGTVNTDFDISNFSAAPVLFSVYESFFTVSSTRTIVVPSSVFDDFVSGETIVIGVIFRFDKDNTGLPTATGDYKEYGVEFAGHTEGVTTRRPTLIFGITTDSIPTPEAPPAPTDLTGTLENFGTQGEKDILWDWSFSGTEAGPGLVWHIQTDIVDTFDEETHNYYDERDATEFRDYMGFPDDGYWHTTYYCRVRSGNGYGDWSDWSNTASVSPGIPVAPSNLSLALQADVNSGSNYVRATWVDTSNNEDGFIIQRSPTNDFADTQQFISLNLAENATSYNDSRNWGEATTLYYRIGSYNSDFEGSYAWSNTASISVSTAISPTSSGSGLIPDLGDIDNWGDGAKWVLFAIFAIAAFVLLMPLGIPLAIGGVGVVFAFFISQGWLDMWLLLLIAALVAFNVYRKQMT